MSNCKCDCGRYMAIAIIRAFDMHDVDDAKVMCPRCGAKYIVKSELFKEKGKGKIRKITEFKKCATKPKI